MKKNEKTIYLDNNSTTKIDPQVLDEMLPYYTTEYANPASNHPFGVFVNQKIKDSRSKIAELIGSDQSEIIFTSGATEAINLAIKGLSIKNKGKHIVTVCTEHPAMLDTCRYMENIGYEVSYLTVKEDGIIDLKILENTIREDTVLVSVMFVNNETGVIQPIKEIASITHEKGAIFMCDATQAVGKIPIKVYELGIDLMSFSAHKFYGPKGIGALFIKGKRPNKFKIEPQMHGGGHEKGLRSGTLNVPAIIGFGKAAEIANSILLIEKNRIEKLRNHLEKELLKVKNSKLNGNRLNRMYNITNICFEGVDADALLVGLTNITISNGSACSSNSIEPSHVLKAMGRTDLQAFSSVRISLGRFTTQDDIIFAISEIPKVIVQLRELTN
jgi:cysteine desulfurase